jgi:hypothetical protein
MIRISFELQSCEVLIAEYMHMILIVQTGDLSDLFVRCKLPDLDGLFGQL